MATILQGSARLKVWFENLEHSRIKPLSVSCFHPFDTLLLKDETLLMEVSRNIFLSQGLFGCRAYLCRWHLEIELQL